MPGLGSAVRKTGRVWRAVLLSLWLALVGVVVTAAPVAASRLDAPPTSAAQHTISTYDASARAAHVRAERMSRGLNRVGERLATSGGVDGSGCGCADAANTAAELPEGYSSFSAAKRAMGSPGEGNVFDHVVEQSQIGRSGFAPEEIHNPFNMNPVSARANQLKANYYSTKQPFTGGGTVRDWLTGQSFQDQYEFGMDVLRQIAFGVLQ